MKRTIFTLAAIAINIVLLSSCSTSRTYTYPYAQNGPTIGTVGENTGVIIDDKHTSMNSFDLIPIGDRISYTIDYGTPEGRQKLQGLSLNEAVKLVGIEAKSKYNCDSFIKQDVTYVLSKDRECILRVTLNGRPANYKTKSK